MNYEWLALAAALLWGISSLASVTPARHLGTFSYSRWRMGCASLLLVCMSLYSGGWHSLTPDALVAMSLSGLIGIFIGDTALFACFNRMGPRQAGLLFSCHAVFSTLLGFFWLNESMTGRELFGSLLVFLGVIIAIFFGKKRQEVHQLDTISGNIWIGIMLGLLSALCQALGGIISKPIMQAGVDPISASSIRMLAAFIAHVLLFMTGFRRARSTSKINFSIFWLTFLNAFLAMSLGMTLILFALKHGNVGMVAILSSTTPIILLPLLWAYTRKPPNKNAWIGAILAVSGTVILMYKS